LVGNDIVDLDFCEPAEHHHIRYLDRVCAPEEADAVRRSVNPVNALASIWASKEAAYKLLSKQLELPHFVPHQFVAQVENHEGAQIYQKLSILYRGVQADVSILSTERWVHAVAVLPSMKIKWTVGEIEKCFFGSRKASTESEAVRFLAHALLAQLGPQDVTLQFEGRVPQLKRKGGGHSGMYVSLSHHGAFAAAAIAWPACGPVPESSDDARLALAKNSEAVCSTCTA
jgi:phosphopantetheinyl transferase (holo-ACP synthase)